MSACASNKESVDTTKDPEFAPEMVAPPVLNISHENRRTHAERGTFSWSIHNDDGSEVMTSSDSEGPTELVKNTNPLKVPPKAIITLEFNDKPKEMLVNIWEDDKQIKQDFADMKLIVPESKGLVIYEVIATWEQGTSHYAFLVKVK